MDDRQDNTTIRMPGLADAMTKAQASVKAVEKDATNAYHRYKYASADAVIEEARRVLAEAGVAVFVTGWTLVPAQVAVPFGENALPVPTGTDLARVEVTYRVACGSDFIVCVTDSYIVPEKGRPEDKAHAGALTTNLSYFLRGLLLIPREDPETSVETRDDTGYVPRGRASAPAADPVACPRCGVVGSLKKNKGVWQCWKSLGGCEASFSEDPATAKDARLGKPTTPKLNPSPPPATNEGPAGPPAAPPPGRRGARAVAIVWLKQGKGETAEWAPTQARLLDLASAAAYLSVSPWTLRDFVAAGLLARVMLPSPQGGPLKRWLFDVADLDRLVEQGRG